MNAATEHVKSRPTGISGAIATLLVIGASWAGLDLTPEEAAGIVGAVVTIVSYFTPR